MGSAAEQQDSFKGFGEAGPEWQTLVNRLNAAGRNNEGIVLTARDVTVLNIALRVLADYIVKCLKGQISDLARSLGLS